MRDRRCSSDMSSLQSLVLWKFGRAETAFTAQAQRNAETRRGATRQMILRQVFENQAAFSRAIREDDAARHPPRFSAFLAPRRWRQFRSSETRTRNRRT